MAIASHTIEVGAVQANGLLAIVERYVRGDGSSVTFVTSVPQATDLNAWATARIATINASDQAAEVTKNITAVEADGSIAAPTFVYSTPAQNAAALRAAYQFATRTQAIMIGDFLNSLTDVQLENAFGLTAGQVATLRTNKLAPAATAAATIRAAAGQ